MSTTNFFTLYELSEVRISRFQN